jgi:lysozyme
MSLTTFLKRTQRFLKMRAREFIIVGASLSETATAVDNEPFDIAAMQDNEPFDIAAMNKDALDRSFADIYKNKDLPEPVAQEPEDPYADIEDVEAVKRMIKQHEGRRLQAYADDAAQPDNPRYYSIGYGHQIKPGEDLKSITGAQADELFDQDFPKYYNAAKNVPGWDKMSSKQRGAVVDLTYNMGTEWYKKFPKFSAAAAKGDWQTAADELVDSRWYNQVGYRGRRIVDMMRRGGNYRDDMFYAGNKNNIDDLFKG